MFSEIGVDERTSLFLDILEELVEHQVDRKRIGPCSGGPQSDRLRIPPVAETAEPSPDPRLAYAGANRFEECDPPDPGSIPGI